MRNTNSHKFGVACQSVFQYYIKSFKVFFGGFVQLRPVVFAVFDVLTCVYSVLSPQSVRSRSSSLPK